MNTDEIRAHAVAMQQIKDALRPFAAEEQMVILSGVLGDVVSICGPSPSRHSAAMFTGTAMEMVFDMIGRNFDPQATLKG